MPPARDVWRRVGGALASVLVGALALVPGLELWRFATSSPALPQWDMAAHGVQGLRLADAVRQFDPLGWLVEVHSMSTWPPTWALVESAAFLVFGGDVSVARGLVAICWMLSVVAAFWALRAIAPGPRGDAAGLLAAAWVAQAPLLQALSTVNLLEVPGTLGLMVCLGCALRALDPDSDSHLRARWWRATWLSALALFFLKYNYGLLWLLPLLLSELVRRRGDDRGDGRRDGRSPLVEWGWRRLRSIRWTPWTIFVAVYLVLLAVIRLSGGIDTEIFGQRLRATSIGNPAYALLLLVCLRTALGGRPAWDRLRRRWRRLDASWHGLASLLIAPIFVWMLLPPHVQEFFGFVENRSSDLSVGESLAFYPRVVLDQYSSAPWLGVATMLLALVGLGWLRSRDARHRLLALTTLVAWLALSAHPYKLPRFAVQGAVLLGCLAAAWLLTNGLVTTGLRWRRLQAAAMPLGVVAVVCVLWFGIDRTFVEMQHRLRTVPVESTQVVDASAHVAAEGGVVLGTWNQLSPGLVEWRARAGPSLDAGWRPVTTLDLERRQRADAVLGQLDSKPCRDVAWVRSDRPGWTEENAWLLPVEARLRESDSRWAAQEAVPGLVQFRCTAR